MPISFVSSLDDSAFNQGLRRMEKGALSAVDKISGSFKSLGAIGGSLGIAGVGAGIGMLGKAVFNMAGDLADTSAALGITTDRLQGLGSYFETVGVSGEKFRLGLTKSAEAIESIREGAGPARSAIEKLGLSFEQVQGSSPDEFILQISEAFSKSTDRGTALTAVIDLLGKSGAKMASGMGEGRAAIEQFADEAAKMNAETVKQFDELGDKIGMALRRGVVESANYGGMALNTLKGQASDLWTVLSGHGSDLFKPKPGAIARDSGEFNGPANQVKREDPLVKQQIDERDKWERQQVQDFHKFKGDEAEKSAKAERDLDEDLAKSRMAALRETVEQGNKLYMDSLKTKREAEKQAAQDRVNDLKAGLQAGENRLQAALGDEHDFERSTSDERRQAHRDRLRNDRIDRTVARRGENFRDARVGAGRVHERAKFELGNVQELSKALAAAMAVENDKLVLKL